MCSDPLAFSCGPVEMVGIGSSFGALGNDDVSSVFLLELPLSVLPGSSVPSVVSLAVVPQVWGVASSLCSRRRGLLRTLVCLRGVEHPLFSFPGYDRRNGRGGVGFIRRFFGMADDESCTG